MEDHTSSSFQSAPKKFKSGEPEKSIRDDDLFSWTSNLMTESEASAVFAELLNIDKQVQKEYNFISGRNRVDNHVDIYADREVDTAVAIGGEYDDSLPAILASIAAPGTQTQPTQPDAKSYSSSSLPASRLNNAAAAEALSPSSPSPVPRVPRDYGNALVADDDDEGEKASVIMASSTMSDSASYSSVHPPSVSGAVSAKVTAPTQPSDFFQSLSQAVAHSLSVSPSLARSSAVLSVERAAKERMRAAFREQRGLQLADRAAPPLAIDTSQAIEDAPRYGDKYNISEKDIIPDMEWEFLIEKIGSAPPSDNAAAAQAAGAGGAREQAAVQESIAKILRDTRARLTARAQASVRRRKRARTRVREREGGNESTAKGLQTNIQPSTSSTPAITQGPAEASDSEEEEDAVGDVAEAFINTEEEDFSRALSSLSYSVLREHVAALLDAASREYARRVAERERRAAEEVQSRAARVRRRKELLGGAGPHADAKDGDDGDEEERVPAVLDDGTLPLLLPLLRAETSAATADGPTSTPAAAVDGSHGGPATSTSSEEKASGRPFPLDYASRDLFAMLRGEVATVDADDAWLQARLREELVPSVFDEEDLEAARWGVVPHGMAPAPTGTPVSATARSYTEMDAGAVSGNAVTAEESEPAVALPADVFAYGASGDDTVDALSAHMRNPFEDVFTTMRRTVQGRCEREQQRRARELAAGGRAAGDSGGDVAADGEDTGVAEEASFMSAGLGAFALSADAEARLVGWLHGLSVEEDGAAAGHMFTADEAAKPLDSVGIVEYTHALPTPTVDAEMGVPAWLLPPSAVFAGLAAHTHMPTHVDTYTGGEAMSAAVLGEQQLLNPTTDAAASTSIDPPSDASLGASLAAEEQAERWRVAVLDMALSQADAVADAESEDDSGSEDDNGMFEDAAPDAQAAERVPPLLPLGDDGDRHATHAHTRTSPAPAKRARVIDAPLRMPSTDPFAANEHIFREPAPTDAHATRSGADPHDHGDHHNLHHDHQYGPRDQSADWGVVPLAAAMAQVREHTAGVPMAQTQRSHATSARGSSAVADEFDFLLSDDSDDDWSGEDTAELGLESLVSSELRGDMAEDLRAVMLRRILGVDDIARAENKLATVYGVGGRGHVREDAEDAEDAMGEGVGAER